MQMTPVIFVGSKEGKEGRREKREKTKKSYFDYKL